MNTFRLKLDGETREFVETETTISLILYSGELVTIEKNLQQNMFPPVNCKEDFIAALKMSGLFTIEEVV